jgi:hypothetical protein
MNASRESAVVTWWRMGKTATERWGFEQARVMADDIKNSFIRAAFMDGASGKPKPLVRRKETAQ